MLLALCAALSPGAATARLVQAVIAAPDHHAAEAVRKILAEGGSLMDAAIAAELVLAVVEPGETGPGGGGFLFYRDGATGRLTVYDGRETAPAAAHPARFLLPGGLPMPKPLAVISGRSVGVPGLIAMLAAAHADHGRLPWARLFEPAIEIAESGVPLPPRLAAQLDSDPTLDLVEGTRRLFGDIVDRPAGRLRNPALADSLRRIAADGPQAIYRGDLAGRIAAATRARRPFAGDMRRADLAGYRARRRAALCGDYRGWRVCGPPPPSSGAIAILQILGLLERMDFTRHPPLSARAIHLVAEASRLAYADRRRHIGDPDFVDVPVRDLLSAPYLDARAALISPRRAMRSAPAGAPPEAIGQPDAAPPPADGNTSHLSIMDAQGNAVALTGSLEAPFGSRIAVGGFLLNNQLTDFDVRPGRNGYPRANAVAPGKRPMSAMSPIIVTDKAGRVRLVVGSRGGPRIIAYVVKVLVAVLDWEMTAADAVALPNFVHTGNALELEAGTRLEALAPSLRAMGHEVDIAMLTSGLHAVEWTEAGPAGGADPRLGGAVRVIRTDR